MSLSGLSESLPADWLYFRSVPDQISHDKLNKISYFLAIRRRAVKKRHCQP